MAHIIGQGEVAACIIAMPPTFIGAALQLGGEVKVNPNVAKTQRSAVFRV
jgi:hypothetical protein